MTHWHQHQGLELLHLLLQLQKNTKIHVRHEETVQLNLIAPQRLLLEAAAAETRRFPLISVSLLQVDCIFHSFVLIVTLSCLHQILGHKYDTAPTHEYYIAAPHLHLKEELQHRENVSAPNEP